ncbi:hypothetical_protein [Leishmania braziliensis MHOM/BR/75/M2904]|uniref:Hypothetical_protein n=1 Tax=Leishmania braziliensis MHOM/BR/75/M2904 TaxID=420245 RepID=A0A3P3ZF41_LEIBR|nr:hypothetical_protein [Leishmania braziliensis MHOM/BR/75/M2904]
MSTSSLASPTTEKAQKLKEAQLKIGMALKNAQYALTTHAHRGLTTALHENASALTALSTYLSLSGSPVKAAAIAGQMAKILKSVGTYVSAKERNSSTSQHTEVSRLSSSFNTPPSSSVVLDELGLLPETPHESAGLVAELQRVVRELTRERDAMADEKRALEAALEESRQHSTVTPHTAFEAHSPDTADKDLDVVIRQLHAEVKGLKHEVREEHMRAAALQDQLHEAEEQIEDQQDQVQALKMQLRLSQEEKLSQDAAFAKKEEEIKALQEAFLQNSRNTTAPSSAAAAAATRSPHGYVDKDDFDALKLQNQLLQQALREQTTQTRPTDPHALLSQQTLEEIEADHHQQLEAMKLTIQEQYNRENQLLDKQRSMQDTLDDLKRQLQLSSNRQWVQQEREKHLNEMDSAERHMEHLQETVERHEQHIHLQQTKLQHYAENERSTSDVIKNLEQHHDTQIAKLNQQIIELRDELNKACRREQELHDQVQASNTETQATIAATTEQYNHHQQHISSLTHSMAAEREQHESRVAELQRAHAAQVAELQQRLEVERDHAAANQSTAAECESALQQRLSELRTSMAAEREQHESRVAELQRAHAAQVAELQQRLEVERDHAAANQSTAAECESALQQRLSELRTSMAAEREQHESRVAELQRAHAAQVAELQQRLEVERDHAAANQSTAAECESALQQRLSELRTSMAAEREQHESRVAELQRAHATQVAEVQQAHATQVAELQQRLEVERDHAAANQSTAAECESALQQRLSELRTSMAAEREQHESRVAELQRAHATQVAELQQRLEVERDHAAANQSTAAECESALQQRLSELRTSMAAEREQHESRVAELQRAHATQVAEVQQAHATQVAELQQRLEVERDHAAANQSTAAECESALQQRLSELRTSMAAEREQHESRVAELQRAHATQVAEVQQAHAAQVAELQQRLEVERDHAAANQSTAAECESALQQRLSELRTSMAAEREQHESRVAELQRAHAAQVAELQQRLEVERDHAAANQSTAAECESALQQRLSELHTSMAAEREQHESRVAELQRAHAAQVAELQQGRELNVLRDESAEKFWVTSQPVDWLKEENESLKVQVREWEEKHTEVTKEKVNAVIKVGEVEEMLSCCKCELQRLKAEYSSLQKTMSKSLEERDIAVKRLKESAHLTEEAEANAVRLETLRKELQEVQERLEITDKDRALVVSRYRRATTEKEECADAARRLLTEYKEMAATREKLVAQLAAAEALAAERSREVEELTRAAPAGASLKSSGPKDDALEAVGQKVVQSTVSEKQERIEALVGELEAVTRENKRLRSELEVAQVRQAAPQRASLTAEPTSMQSAFAQDMLSSLAGMRVTLNTMHTQLVPILEQIRVEERSRAAAAVDPSASTSAVDALEKLYTSMESVHAVTQATLEDFDIGARQLRVSAELQAVVYGKLLATLQQHRGKGSTSPLTSTLVDVSLVRACAALFGELSTGSTPRWEENERHGEQQLISHTDQRYRPGRASSATRDYVAAAEKDRQVAVSATAHQQSPSTWSHYHAFSSAPSVFASSVGVDNRGRYSRTVNHARRRADDRELSILDNAGYGRQPSRAGSRYQSSFENFAMAQASISVAEERARLRTAPTPPWR